MKTKNKFCSHPFNKVLFNYSGEVIVCCESWLDMPIGNIFQQSFRDIWNSPEAMKIRESILDGSFRYCNAAQCPRIVSGLIERDPWREEFLDVIENKKLFSERGPRLISLNYDISCNLHCKSCRNSVFAIDQNQQAELIRFQDALLESGLFDNVRRLTVSGAGEPFASIVYMSLFNKIKQEKFPRLKIDLRSNGLLLTPGNWQRIEKVHYAIDMISISVDAAVPETYSHLRRGANFGKLLTNLAFLKEIKKKKKFNVKLNFVVQKANYSEMVDFVKLAKKYDCDLVAFTKIFDLGTYDPGGFAEAAVHNPGHPEFEKFREVINDPIFRDPIVRLRNLSNLVDR